MPKNINTPRDELVCGKLDRLVEKVAYTADYETVQLIRAIRHDCERMEAKLVSRKAEVESLASPQSVPEGLRERRLREALNKANNLLSVARDHMALRVPEVMEQTVEEIDAYLLALASPQSGDVESEAWISEYDVQQLRTTDHYTGKVVAHPNRYQTVRVYFGARASADSKIAPECKRCHGLGYVDANSVDMLREPCDECGGRGTTRPTPLPDGLREAFVAELRRFCFEPGRDPEANMALQAFDAALASPQSGDVEGDADEILRVAGSLECLSVEKPYLHLSDTERELLQRASVLLRLASTPLPDSGDSERLVSAEKALREIKRLLDIHAPRVARITSGNVSHQAPNIAGNLRETAKIAARALAAMRPHESTRRVMTADEVGASPEEGT